jgi:Flp pilus assembly protein TadD
MLAAHRHVVRALVIVTFAAWIAGCASLPKSAEAQKPEASGERATQAIANGDAAAQRGDRERALFEYVRALNEDARNETALARIGALHVAGGKLELAKATFRHLLALNGKNAGAWEGLGLVLLRESNYDEAAEHLHRALDLNGDLWRSHNGLGLIEDMKGNAEAAAGHYQAALVLQPELPMLLNNIGYSRYLAGDMQSAESYFDAVLVRDPKSPRAWSNLALVAARRGDYKKALHALRQVGEEAQALNDLGYLCLINGNYDDAEDFLRRAIKLSPGFNDRAQKNLTLLSEKRGGK